MHESGWAVLFMSLPITILVFMDLKGFSDVCIKLLNREIARHWQNGQKKGVFHR